MALATPADREFKVLRAGDVRDKIVLANFREGLRALVNPETGNAFTEEEIASATRPGSTWAVRAQAIDDLAQQDQRNALYLADQVRLDRATGKWLVDFHGKTWNVSPLGASGGSGDVTVTGTAGTIILGSTNIPDDNAYKARDPAGNLYQVFETAVVPTSTFVDVTLVALSTGDATNIPEGTVLTWTLKDPNMKATAIVAEDFRGGTDQETEAEYASRIQGIIQFRPGAGNDAHFRAWARESSNAVEEGFVYPCAMHNGSVIVAVTQKRKHAKGPLARIASASTLNAAIGYLTPPASPVVPPRPFVIVTPAVSAPSNVVLRMSMQRASLAGWADAQPFPSYSTATPFVVSVSTQTHFQLGCEDDATLPGQAPLASLSYPNTPRMMLWNGTKSEWEELQVSAITDLGAGLYDVVLSSPPTFTIVSNQLVSPATGRRAVISQAVQDYFDELGPGDFFDVTTDVRGARCVRFPDYQSQWPIEAGSVVATRVADALGGSSANVVLASMSITKPSYQPSYQSGPKMLTLGKLGIYAS